MSTLAELFGMSLPAVMQHLQILQESGLVTSLKKGRVRTYWLEAGAFNAAEGWMAEQKAHWEMQADRLGDYISELKKENKND